MLMSYEFCTSLQQMQLGLNFPIKSAFEFNTLKNNNNPPTTFSA